MTYLDQVVRLTKAGKYQICFEASKVDEVIDNPDMSETKYRISKGNQTSGTVALKKVRDGHKFDHTFQIIGFLGPQDYDNDGVVETAKQAKDYFYEIINYSGDLLFTYRDYSDKDYGDEYKTGATADATYIHVAFVKVEFSDSIQRRDLQGVAGQEQGKRGGVARYAVTLKLTKALTR